MSPEAVTLSVVIPTMNKRELLGQTLEAVLAQDPGPGRSFEVVVVDDGSTDDTAAFLQQAVTSEKEKGQNRLRPVTPGKNVGRARARNFGACEARGHWLLFLDDDIVAPEGLLAAHLDLLMAGPDTGTIGYAVTDPQLIDAPHFHYMDSRGVARLEDGPAPGRYFVTQNAGVSREAFLSVGGFDEGFSGYGFEDMEVAFRLEDLAGVKFQALTQPVPVHVHHHTSAQYFEKKWECGRQSLPYVANLHPARIPEMQLHHVMDFEGQEGLAVVSRLIRSLADTPLGAGLPRWLERWPVGEGQMPRWPGFYFRLMSLAVLFSFRRGVTGQPWV